MYKWKIDKTIESLKLASEMSEEFYNKPLIITYSGGKDSDVLLDIARRCLKPDVHIREVFKGVRGGGTKCTVHIPKDKDGKQITMWNLIQKKKIPPTRLYRYCCSELKETSTLNRICAVGVRESECTGRRGKDIFSTRGKTKKEYNPLYDRGYKRVGCVGCPMASYKDMNRGFAEYPKIKDAYIRAFQRMIDQYDDETKSKMDWKSGQDVFDWWTERWKHEVKGQMNLDEFINIKEQIK